MVLSMFNVRSATRSKQSLKPSDPDPAATDMHKTVDVALNCPGADHVGEQIDSTHDSDTPQHTVVLHRPAPAFKRFSFRSMGFFSGDKDIVTPAQIETEKLKAKDAAKHEQLVRNIGRANGVNSVLARRADTRAQKNALAVQKLIVGPSAITLKEQHRGGNTGAGTGKAVAPVSRVQLVKIKTELMQPKTANKLIAKLRELPSITDTEEDSCLHAEVEAGSNDKRVSLDAEKKAVKTTKSHPIHAVCLSEPEQHISATHFAKLDALSVSTASLASLSTLFSSLQIVDLITAPNLGLGAPGDAEGILAGAVPTAETIIRGAEKLTPQLMDLGYATGRAIVPDHSTVHPPTDRLSVLTYWWGLELCLPPPTLAHLAQAPSIAHELINFLSALALMNDGVRECLPFVRYMSQFVDFEWKEIQSTDEGRGVVCAATWIMPAALVPRPWDFPEDSAPVPASASPSKPEMKGPPATPNPNDSPAHPTEGKKGPEKSTETPIELPHPPAISPVPSLLVTPPSNFHEDSGASSNAKKEAGEIPSTPA